MKSEQPFSWTTTEAWNCPGNCGCQVLRLRSLGQGEGGLSFIFFLLDVFVLGRGCMEQRCCLFFFGLRKKGHSLLPSAAFYEFLWKTGGLGGRALGLGVVSLRFLTLDLMGTFFTIESEQETFQQFAVAVQDLRDVFFFSFVIWTWRIWPDDDDDDDDVDVDDYHDGIPSAWQLPYHKFWLASPSFTILGFVVSLRQEIGSSSRVLRTFRGVQSASAFCKKIPIPKGWCRHGLQIFVAPNFIKNPLRST